MIRIIWWAMQAVTAALVVAGCRGDDECEETDHADIGGTWNVTRTVTADSCDPESVGEEETGLATVTQNDADLEIDLWGSIDLNGEICGDHFSAGGTSTDDIFGCVLTQTVTIAGAVDGDRISGQSSWSYRTNQDPICLGVDTCSGGYSFTAERQ